ncbi:MAG: T9SS type A sorting domain-containing protein [Flavobacteriales bacterium]|nr:T9SS type A sorting domain-containing protein [Flavobacteriales bacterium]
MKSILIVALFTLSIECFAQPYGGFLSMDGVNDFTQTSDTLLKGASDKTIEAYVAFCPSTSSVTHAGLMLFTNQSDSLKLNISINASGTLASLFLTDGHQSNAFNIPIFSYSNWNHLAMTIQSADSLVQLYFNGDSLGGLKSTVINSVNTFIGHSIKPAKCTIDELRFSSMIRYSTSFIPPANAFNVDTSTIELFKFEEGQDSMRFYGVNSSELVGRFGAHSNGIITVSNDSSICLGDSIQLKASGGTRYSWSPSLGLNNNSAYNPTCNTLIDQTYHVVISDSNGCAANKSVTINILSLPKPTLGADTIICGGDSVSLHPGNFSSYLWSNGAVSQNQNLGKGDHWVRVMDTAGCKGFDTIQITERPPIKINLGNDTLVRYGTTFYLDPGPGFKTYKWSTLETSQKILTSLAMVYSVTVTDTFGCAATDKIRIAFNTVGTKEYQSMTRSISVFPNPISPSGTLYFETGQLELNPTVSVFSTNGARADHFITGSTPSIKLDNLTPGIYLVQMKLAGSEALINKKLIVTDYP